MATSRTSLVNSPKSTSSGQELMAASTTTTAMPVTTTTDGIGAIIVAGNSSNHHHNQLEVNLNSIDDDAIIAVTTNNSAILNNANSIVVSDANSIVTSADFIASDILPVIGHYGTYHDISQMQAPQHSHQQSQTHHHPAIYHPMQHNSQNISSNTTVLVDSSSSTSAPAIVTTATPATITRRIITPNDGINSATDKRMIINIDTTSTTPTLITESLALGRRVSAGTVTHMLVDECCPTTTTTSPILTQQHHPTILLHTSSLVRTTATSSTQQLVLPSIITSSATSSSTALSPVSATPNGITSNLLDQQMPSTSYNVSPSSSQASTSIGSSTIVHHHITTIPSNVSDSGRKIKSSRYQQQTTTGQQHHQQHVAVVNTTATNTISENDLLSAAAHSLSDNLPSGNLINDHMSVVSTNVASDITQSNCNDSGNVILQQQTTSQDTPNTTSTTTASVSGANTVSSSPGNNSASNLNLHINSDSCDSANMEIKDISLDDNDGYQDNTSSNSQQSAGGGSVSGGGGAGGSGNGNGISGNGSSASGSYLSLIPPPVGTSGPAQCGEQTDFKYLFEELCPVCGDKVSGYHYGLLTCESCKGFFKRTVQNKKVYTCVAERSCHIDKTQRKRCPYCRFQKCLEVGMKLEAVRADRMRGGRNKFGPMYKRDRARKLQMMRQRQLALQAIRGSMSSTDVKIGQLSPTGYQQSYPSMSIKQEIQIPQVSSLTQSPDSSPSPIAIALGQIPQSTAVNANSIGNSSGTGSTNTTTVSGTGGGGGSGGGGAGGGCGPGGDAGPASLQHTSDSKLCFDTGTNPTSTADSVSTVEPLRVSPMIREFVQSIDDREWQTQLFTLLQKQSYNQVEVDLFELMCKVLDQNLFSQVDWARNTIFFKDLKVDDQMKLLQNSWSDMLVLDHLHQRIHNGLPDETPLHNGQIFHLLGLGLFGLPQLADYFNELQNKLQELKFDMGDYVCMKFLLLLNPDVRGIINKKTVLEGYENVQAALLDYTLTCYPSVTDKFSRLLNILPEIHAVAARGESHLYQRHCAGNAPTQTLLMEMLHAKRKI